MARRKIDLRDWTDPLIGEVPNSDGHVITWPANRLMTVDSCDWVADVPVDPEATIVVDGQTIRCDINDDRVVARLVADFDGDVDVEGAQGAQDAPQTDSGAGATEDTGDDVAADSGRPKTLADLDVSDGLRESIMADERVTELRDLVRLAMEGELTTIAGVGEAKAEQLEGVLLDAGLIF